MVGNSPELQKKIIQLFHDSPMGGHLGVQDTIKRLTSELYQKGLRKQVREYVCNCSIYLQRKLENVANPDLLQPLPIPDYAFKEVNMDFIEGLPRLDGQEVIFVVVDSLAKHAHFTALKHPYFAAQVARLYLDSVYKQHEMPQAIISNRDPIFLSSFQQNLFQLQGVELHLSSAYHLSLMDKQKW